MVIFHSYVKLPEGTGSTELEAHFRGLFSSADKDRHGSTIAAEPITLSAYENVTPIDP